MFSNHSFNTVVEPLGPEDVDLRLHTNIRVKVKKGWIHRRLAFRFFAVEIEDSKCYLITGATIKIHKFLHGADCDLKISTVIRYGKILNLKLIEIPETSSTKNSGNTFIMYSFKSMALSTVAQPTPEYDSFSEQPYKYN